MRRFWRLFHKEMIGVVVVDHGSREPESNEAFLRVVKRFADRVPEMIVEPAHMSLSSPTIEEAFDKLVQRGARRVVIHPYFLLPGRHWREDIPALAQKAGQKHPSIPWNVTAPLGESDHILDLVAERIEDALRDGPA